jgi:hypothetical protein
MDVDINCHLRSFKKNCTFPRIKHEKDFTEWQTMLIELQKTFPSLIVIDFTDIICNKEECFLHCKILLYIEINSILPMKGQVF